MKFDTDHFLKHYSLILLTAVFVLIGAFGLAGCGSNTSDSSPVNLTKDPKEASSYTLKINEEIGANLNTESITHENDLAKKGLIAEKKALVIPRADGKVQAWDMTSYEFLTGNAPATVNPKLWEHAKINMNIGLYQVTDNIYQVRGFDLANITFIRGKSGYIVIDPLTAAETAAEAYKFVCEELGKKPITAIIFTHSHVDHYGGVNGVTDETAKVKPVIYAPDGFLDAVVEENLYAGVAMMRRSFFMYGTILARGPKGQVDGGLGKYAANGTQGLRIPDVTISKETEKLKVDGLDMTFQLTKGTEAPSEMNIYVESEKSLCVAENCTATLHNLYTLRGAQVRDPEKWADYLDDSIELFGSDLTSVFSSHNWPRWGQDECVGYMRSQRDCYQFIKDQTLRLMSKGYTIDEVGRMIEMPKTLEADFFNGEFYGTVSHNAKAVYQKYLGWYDSNPVNLNKLLPEDSSKKYVEYMGGADNVLKQAEVDFEKGEYQWVAEVTKQVIYSDPENERARLLCADSLEQLGYIAESGPWRNEYLYAASELRNGIKLPPTGGLPVAIYNATSMKQLAGMIALRLKGEEASARDVVFAIQTTDAKRAGVFHLRNGILAFLGEKSDVKPAFTVKMPIQTLYIMVAGAKADLEYTVEPASAKATFEQFLGLLDTSNPSFNIVTP